MKPLLGHAAFYPTPTKLLGLTSVKLVRGCGPAERTIIATEEEFEAVSRFLAKRRARRSGSPLRNHKAK